MAKKHYLLGVASLLLIPAVVLLGATLSIFINPEIAAGHANYERNYLLLELAKTLCLWATGLVSMVLWFLTGFFLVKSKSQSYKWLPMLLLGPFGFVVLTLLRDKAAAPWDLYQQFMRRLHPVLRVAYKLS